MNNILSLKEFDFSNVVFSPAVATDDFVVIKIWYRFSRKRIETVFIENPELRLAEMDENELTFDLTDNKLVNEFYDKCDQHSISHIKDIGLVKKFDLGKGLKYNSLINLADKDGSNMITMRQTSSTLYFDLDKKKLSQKERDELLKEKDCKLRSIVELESIIVDKKNKTIYTNIIPRQFKIQSTHVEPMHVSLSTYSFIDEDDTREQNENVNNNQQNMYENVETVNFKNLMHPVNTFNNTHNNTTNNTMQSNQNEYSENESSDSNSDSESDIDLNESSSDSDSDSEDSDKVGKYLKSMAKQMSNMSTSRK